MYCKREYLCVHQPVVNVKKTMSVNLTLRRTNHANVLTIFLTISGVISEKKP